MTDTAPRPVGRPKLPPRENVTTMTVRDVPHAHKLAMLMLAGCDLTVSDASGDPVMLFNGNSANSMALSLFEAGLRYVAPVIATEIEAATFERDALNEMARMFLADMGLKIVKSVDFAEGSPARKWIETEAAIATEVNANVIGEERIKFEGVTRKAALDGVAAASTRLENLEAAAEAVAKALAPVE